MVLRRGDWETGDVICHECHLTAPPLLPSSLLFHISPFLFPTSSLIVCLSLRSPLFIVMIYLNTFYISHLSSSRLSCSLTLHISSPYFRTALPTYIYCTESPNIALGDMKQTHTNIHTDTPTVFANALKNTYTSVNVSCVSNGVWRASKMLLCCSVSDSCCLVMAALLTETTLGQLSSLFLLSASVPSVCSHCRMCLCLTCCLLLSLL